MKTIKGQTNELFIIESVNTLDGMGELKAHLVAQGFEPVLYTMKRVVSGRKKPYSVGNVMRSTATGEFQ
jgi:hypothetical protein